MSNSPKMDKAIDETMEKLLAMSPEELSAAINQMDARNSCDPDTCAGECQGSGTCKVCVEFNEIDAEPSSDKE